jgi:hypothetical protein
MNRKVLALVGGVIVVASALGGAVALGFVPGASGGDSAGSPPTVAEPAAENETETEPAGFEFEVTNLSECGRTCRLMESELTNAMNESASNVTLTYDVYAGGNSTVWEGRESLGSLAANATSTQEARIEVGMGGGLKIRQNGGNATIITTVYAGGEERAQFSNTQNVD